MNEVWKDVVGYEGLYQVSSIGRVKSISRYGNPEEIIMKQGLTEWGYPKLTLCKYAKQRQFTIHRLVALAFLSNPESLPQVNHINCNKEDNSVENLEWCTSLENIKHAYRNGLIKISNKGRAAISASTIARQKKRIKITDTLSGKATIYNSVGEAAQVLNCGLSGISTCLARKSLLFKRYKSELMG